MSANHKNNVEINPILPTFSRSSGMPLGSVVGGTDNNKFEGAVLPPTLPERSPQRAVKAGNDRARSAIDQLLFQWADKIEFESSPAARERKVRSVYSIFRIPTTAKQPSRSP
ncbi:hypothetical protein pipiens_012406 [Culex pipiens pipiens]|uniref:Uncharacterized protein n=1 Tax=Culex pipiens pipiens TaxID=38569 RepID=A0ABD1CXY9_CULPP